MSEEDQPAADEALQFIEGQKAKAAENLDDEMAEYTAMRKEEKEREAKEIEELRIRRAERLKEREEEEKRMVVQRKEEEARRKAEEEERKMKKAEEEVKRKEERERKRREAEKRMGPKVPNFTIVKQERGKCDGDDDDKPPQKSKEELEKEKQAALASRISPLDVDNANVEQMSAAAKDMLNQIRNLVSSLYNLEDRYKRQQYDIVELQERTRAMSKTKKRGVTSVQYDDSYDRMNDRFANAPVNIVDFATSVELDQMPKILVANKYEGNLDRRTWNEKVACYNEKEDLVELNKLYAIYLTGGY